MRSSLTTAAATALLLFFSLQGTYAAPVDGFTTIVARDVDATNAVDVTNAVDATDAVDVTDAIDATDATDAVDDTDATATTDAVDATDATTDDPIASAVAAGVAAGAAAAKPVDAHLNCDGFEELCDANCYAILCQGKPTLLHKATTAQGNTNREAAGTNRQPFKFPTRYHVTRPDGLHVSAEEYPFASTREGGTGANLFPVTVAMQTKQRNAISDMYNKAGLKGDKNAGKAFNLHFDHTKGPYCPALAKNDKSVCDKKKNESGPWGFDFGKYDYVRTSPKGKPLKFDPVGKQKP